MSGNPNPVSNRNNVPYANYATTMTTVRRGTNQLPSTSSSAPTSVDSIPGTDLQSRPTVVVTHEVGRTMKQLNFGGNLSVAFGEELSSVSGGHVFGGGVQSAHLHQSCIVQVDDDDAVGHNWCDRDNNHNFSVSRSQNGYLMSSDARDGEGNLFGRGAEGWERTHFTHAEPTQYRQQQQNQATFSKPVYRGVPGGNGDSQRFKGEGFDFPLQGHSGQSPFSQQHLNYYQEGEGLDGYGAGGFRGGNGEWGFGNNGDGPIPQKIRDGSEGPTGWEKFSFKSHGAWMATAVVTAFIVIGALIASIFAPAVAPILLATAALCTIPAIASTVMAVLTTISLFNTHSFLNTECHVQYRQTFTNKIFR